MKLQIFWRVINPILLVAVLPRTLLNVRGLGYQEGLKKTNDYELPGSEYTLKYQLDYTKGDNIRNKVYPSEPFQVPEYEGRKYWEEELEKGFFGKKGALFDNNQVYLQEKKSHRPSVRRFIAHKLEDFDVSQRPHSFDTDHQEGIHRIAFGLEPKAANYLRPSKPIRASVIKLETITRSPDLFFPFHYPSTVRQFPLSRGISERSSINSEKLLRGNPIFYDQGDTFIKQELASVSPVISKPNYLTPTTFRPFSTLPNLPWTENTNITEINFETSTKRNFQYVPSMQNQAPRLDLSKSKTPNIARTTTTNTPFTLYWITGTENNLQTPPDKFINLQRFKKVTIPIAEENKSSELQENPNQFVLPTIPENDSIQIVTNLTVEGLKKFEKQTSNVPNHVNYFNIKTLINHDMPGLKNLLRNKFDMNEKNEKNEKTSAANVSRFVNLYDEFSLDAKILKDTQWDGISNKELELQTTTLTASVESKQKPRENLIQEKESSTKEISTNSSQASTVLEIVTSVTTGESPRTNGTPTNTFTPSTEEIGTSPRLINDMLNETTKYLAFEDGKEEKVFTKILESTTVKEELQKKFPHKRKYTRGPKIKSFTPYVMVNETSKKMINRNNFFKRQKPNITLSFGKKNIFTSRSTRITEETMKFSDEDVTVKTRKSGKKRHGVRRRIPTTEHVFI